MPCASPVREPRCRSRHGLRACGAPIRFAALSCRRLRGRARPGCLEAARARFLWTPQRAPGVGAGNGVHFRVGFGRGPKPMPWWCFGAARSGPCTSGRRLGTRMIRRTEGGWGGGPLHESQSPLPQSIRREMQRRCVFLPAFVAGVTVFFQSKSFRGAAGFASGLSPAMLRSRIPICLWRRPQSCANAISATNVTARACARALPPESGRDFRAPAGRRSCALLPSALASG